MKQLSPFSHHRESARTQRRVQLDVLLRVTFALAKADMTDVILLIQSEAGNRR